VLRNLGSKSIRSGKTREAFVGPACHTAPLQHEKHEGWTSGRPSACSASHDLKWPGGKKKPANFLGRVITYSNWMLGRQGVAVGSNGYIGPTATTFFANFFSFFCTFNLYIILVCIRVVLSIFSSSKLKKLNMQNLYAFFQVQKN